jgi:hypothetical protein
MTPDLRDICMLNRSICQQWRTCTCSFNEFSDEFLEKVVVIMRSLHDVLAYMGADHTCLSVCSHGSTREPLEGFG